MRTLAAVLLVLAAACGGAPPPDPNEPTTAKEKQLREAKANGELDSDAGNKWGGWKYQGDRADCFFVVGRKCYKSEKLACNAARCKTPQLCDVDGGGPAMVSCKKPKS